MSKTLVVFGSSTDKDYCFLAPLSAVFWREVVGFEPRVFLVGSEEEWKSQNHTNAALAALRAQGVDVHFTGRIEIGETAEVYPIATTAQHVRYHAAADSSIPDDRWVMMTDADLWPLKGNFYLQHLRPEADDKKVVSYYSNGDHFQGKEDVLNGFRDRRPFQSIPTCHVTMRAKEWRSVYGVTSDDVIGSTKRTLDVGYEWIQSCPDPNFALWCSDQWFVTEHLCRQDWFPDEALMIPRYGHPPLDRLDRSAPADWDKTFEMKYTDAHLLKNPYSDQSWERLLKVVDALVPDDAAWMRSYREDFVR